MIIKEIYLRGFRNFKQEVSLKLDKGYNLLLGANGQGKSTINIYADLNLLNYLEPSTTLADCITLKSDSFESYMIFEQTGKIYKSVMNVSSKGKTPITTRSLEEDGKLIVEGTTAVVSFLAEMFDPVITRYAMALRQGNMEVITCKPAQRFEIFQKVLDVKFKEGLDVVDREISKLKEDLTAIDSKLDLYNSKDYSLQDMIDPIYTTKEIQKLEKDKKDLESQLVLHKSLNDLYKSLTVDVNNITSRIQDIESNISRKSRLKQVTESGIMSLASILASDDVCTIDSKIVKAKSDQSNLNKDTFISTETHSFNKELEAVASSLDEASKELSAFPRKRGIKDNSESLRQDISEITNELTILTLKVKPLESKIAFHSKGTCSECGQKIDSSDVPKLEADLHGINESISVLRDTLSAKTSELNANTKAVKDLQDYNDTREGIVHEVAIWQSKVDSLKDKEGLLQQAALDKFEVAYSKFNVLIDKLVVERESLIQSKTNASSSKEDQLNMILEDIKSLDEDLLLVNGELTTKSKELVDTVQPDSTEITARLCDVTSMLLEHSERISEINLIKNSNKVLLAQKDIDDKALAELEVKKIEKQKSLVLRTEAKKILAKVLPQYIIAETVQDLTIAMNNFIEEIHTKELDIILKSTSTSLKMLSRGKSVATLSGAEKVITSLSFLDALRDFTNLENGSVFLDETDAMVDKVNSLALFDVVENLPYEQIILVTHDDEMKDYFMNKGASAFTFMNNDIVEGV